MQQIDSPGTPLSGKCAFLVLSNQFKHVVFNSLSLVLEMNHETELVIPLPVFF